MSRQWLEEMLQLRMARVILIYHPSGTRGTECEQIRTEITLQANLT